MARTQDRGPRQGGVLKWTALGVLAAAVGCSSPTPDLAFGSGDSNDAGAETDASDDPGSPQDDMMTAGCFDVPEKFRATCGGENICHEGSTPAGGLDLVLPGVEDRVSLTDANMCLGVLGDPSSPKTSVLYDKLAELPSCGSRMPLGGTPYTQQELDCVEEWISGLLPPPPPALEEPVEDGGVVLLCEPNSSEACYNGTAITLNVGICQAGTRTCSADGLEWGPCEGEVTPRGENCLTEDIDENCDGELQTICEDEWAKTFGNDMSQSVRAVASDSENAVYVLGEWMGTVNFGLGDITALQVEEEKRDLFLAKYDEFGNPLWVNTVGQIGNQYAGGLTVDAEDNVIMVGRAFETIQLGGENRPIGGGNDDVFVAKYSPQGTELWSRQFGDRNPDRAERVAVDGNGDVLVVGTFEEDLEISDFGVPNLASAGEDDAFVMKLSGVDGEVLWARALGGPGDDYGQGVYADSDNNVIVGGSFVDTANLAGTELTSAGGEDAFLAKFQADGTVVWVRGFGAAGDDRIGDLAAESFDENCDVDDACEIVVHGYFTEAITFGTDVLTSAGGRDLFVAKVDKNGDGVWALGAGDDMDQLESEFVTWPGLAMDSSGSVVITGAFAGQISWDNSADPIFFLWDGKLDMYLVKLDPDGNFVIGDAFGLPGTEFTLDVAVSPSGHAVIGGRNFGNSRVPVSNAGFIEGKGSSNGFVARFDLGT